MTSFLRWHCVVLLSSMYARPSATQSANPSSIRSSPTAQPMSLYASPSTTQSANPSSIRTSPTAQPTSLYATPSATQSANTSSNQSSPMSQPTSQPMSQPTSQPMSQPKSQPMSQPKSQPPMPISNCIYGRLKVTLMRRPPYVANVSSEFQSQFLLSKIVNYFQNHKWYCYNSKKYECLKWENFDIVEATDEYWLYNDLLSNTTDIAFPHIARKGQLKVDKKMPFLPLLDHPGMSLLVIPTTIDPVSTILVTIVSSWPLLALSLICTAISGIIIWLCETIKNKEEFPKSFRRGSWEGFWWAFITMTTVGYGDKCPRSILGRCFTVMWVFIGLMLVAVFMANITTALTSISVKPSYELANMKVAVFRNTTEEAVAIEEGATVQGFDSFDEMVDALERDKVKGILVDRNTVGFHMKIYHDKKRALNLTTARQIPLTTYAIGLVIGTNRSRQLLMDCGMLDKAGLHKSSDWYWEELKKEALQFVGMDISYVPKSSLSSASKDSFNLFVDSKDDIIRIVFISLGILLALVLIGCAVEFIMNKKAMNGHRVDIESYPNRESKNVELAEGRRMLTELQGYLDRLEHSINNNNNNNNNRFVMPQIE